jgi:hypothetical protein
MKTAIPTSQLYVKIKGKIAEELLILHDVNGIFLIDKLNDQNIKTFINGCFNKPWANHIFLAMMVMNDNNLDPGTINNMFTLGNRLGNIFAEFKLNEMTDFNVDFHMYQYLMAEIFPEHTNSVRHQFCNIYRTIISKTYKWVKLKIDADKQHIFEKFLLPKP